MQRTCLLILICLISLTCSISLTCLATDLININTATLEELDTLPGIGPSKAQAIIDYRNTNGNFSAIEDIMNVSGIGQTTFDNIKNLITVSGSSGNISASSEIVINELLPNPEGSDDAEWIELKNLSDSTINLENWKISDSTKSYTLPSITISTNGFLILEKSDTGISLNNSSGETVSLHNANDELINSITYTESAQENYSYARQSDGNYAWTNTLTKNYENEFSIPDGNKPTSQQTPEESSAPSSSDENASKYKGIIIISEILPNPIGIDDGFTEWIEIHNTTHYKIYLNNWKLKNKTGEYNFGIKKIEPNDFLILRQQETGLNLHNSGDNLELTDGLGKLIDQVEYKNNAPENQSYNWCPNDNKWLWIEKTSLNIVNILEVDKTAPLAYFEAYPLEIQPSQTLFLNAQESYDPNGTIEKYIWNFADQSLTTTSTQIQISFTDSGKQEINLTVIDNLAGEDSFSLEINVLGDEPVEQKDETSQPENFEQITDSTNINQGDDIQFEGQVIVEPGVLGATIFYIANQSFGFQVYCYNKDFPALTLGDLIHVSGEFSEYYNQSRIKIKDQSHITLIESANPPAPIDINLNQNLEKYEGMLVKISGEIVDKEYDNFWLSNNSGEIKVSIKKTTGITAELKIGDQVKITGIISDTQSGYVLLPRYASDISIGQVLGEQNESAKNQKSISLNTYLLLFCVALIIVFIIIFIRKNKTKTDS